MEKASFSIADYYFDKINIDLDYRTKNKFDVSIKPEGLFNDKLKSYELIFYFKAFSEGEENNPFITIKCVGIFEFQNVEGFNDIPSFFYKNALALLFPYLRAFISTVTIQINKPPLILPTFNLSSLESVLIEHTNIKS